MLAGKTKSSQRAELTGALMALRTAHQIRKRNPRQPKTALLARGNASPEIMLRQVLIRTDYAPLVAAMTHNVHYLWDKSEDGYRRRKGKPIPDADLYRAINDEIECLNERGVRVQFLLVPRTENAMAHYLAKSKLKGITAKTAMEKWIQNNKWWAH
jgi:ribonuclease HI